jgi:hypothetical protein
MRLWIPLSISGQLPLYPSRTRRTHQRTRRTARIHRSRIPEFVRPLIRLVSFLFGVISPALCGPVAFADRFRFTHVFSTLGLTIPLAPSLKVFARMGVYPNVIASMSLNGLDGRCGWQRANIFAICRYPIFCDLALSSLKINFAMHHERV